MNCWEQPHQNTIFQGMKYNNAPEQVLQYIEMKTTARFEIDA